MQNWCQLSCILALSCLTTAQDFLDFPPQHGNGFYQAPSFPPHFRPFGFHHGYQPYKDVNYPPAYYDSPFHNDIRAQLPNPYVPDYPNFYQQYPQFDQHYGLHKVAPSYRAPIQIIPSRFPPSVENVVERIQNHFSVYNPGLILPHNPITPLFIEIQANATNVTTTTKPAIESEATTTVAPTDVPSEASTEMAEEIATEATDKDLSEGESNQDVEKKEEETTESSTEVSTAEP